MKAHQSTGYVWVLTTKYVQKYGGDNEKCTVSCTLNMNIIFLPKTHSRTVNAHQLLKLCMCAQESLLYVVQYLCCLFAVSGASEAG